MRLIPLFIVPIMLLLWVLPVCSGNLIRLENGEPMTLEQWAQEIGEVQLVFVGERHDNASHHHLQRQVIQALIDSGKDVAVGLEMFESGNQGVLNAWTEGTVQVSLFQTAWQDQWGYWEAYKELLFFIRRQGIETIGLNIPRFIVRQVARNGFQSLPEHFKKEAGVTECVVTPDYEGLLRRQLSGHGKEPTTEHFQYFCEAQMLWDRSMAQRAEAFLEAHPDKTLVVLAGSVHSWKQGIPRQLKKERTYQVILPTAPGFGQLEEMTPADADFIWAP